ncbi:hypothetical protein SBRY_40737 [Actinacidiphila bryophytorum]|uniref:Uncharacterized protein n=1 Tax=Actinacidiphila bryophytorum TaxID=1436133 RepID=A0A9W4H3N1_9ACTN|nr:hypothetical protein SBRY_40737 [Actinacidiphila bryophytorum]
MVAQFPAPLRGRGPAAEGNHQGRGELRGQPALAERGVLAARGSHPGARGTARPAPTGGKGSARRTGQSAASFNRFNWAESRVASGSGGVGEPRGAEERAGGWGITLARARGKGRRDGLLTWKVGRGARPERTGRARRGPPPPHARTPAPGLLPHASSHP